VNVVQDSTVNEREVVEVLRRFKNERARHLKRKGDPWAFRQALLVVVELDTAAALERGVDIRVLNSFDVTVRADARLWVEEK